MWWCTEAALSRRSGIADPGLQICRPEWGLGQKSKSKFSRVGGMKEVDATAFRAVIFISLPKVVPLSGTTIGLWGGIPLGFWRLVIIEAPFCRPASGGWPTKGRRDFLGWRTRGGAPGYKYVAPNGAWVRKPKASERWINAGF